MKLCAAYRLFNGERFITYSMRSVYDHVERIVIFLSRRPWYGPESPPDATESLLDNFPDPERKITVVKGDWRAADASSPIEVEHSNQLLDYVRTHCPEITHYLFIDYDELYHPDHMRYLRSVLETSTADAFRGVWRCYWRSLHWWVDPPEPSRPLIAFRVQPHTRFTAIREVNGREELILPQERLLIHHFSYALTSEEVAKKVVQWSHASEVARRWYKDVWQRWPRYRMMINLHPCWPTHFGRAVPAPAEQLPGVMREHPYFGKDLL